MANGTSSAQKKSSASRKGGGKGAGARANDPMEALRHRILEEMRTEAVFDGWTLATLKQAAFAAGMSQQEWQRGDIHLAFPDGIADVLDFWSGLEDDRMVAAYETADPAPTRIRDKVTFLVRARLEGLADHREAARRASATLALPPYAGIAARLTWRTADRIWRALGDTSTDYNYYTKRATLSAVYLSTLTHWLADETADEAQPFADSWVFLDKRIENIMQFEKVKGKVLKAVPDPGELFGALGKIRYGGGSSR